MVNLSGILAMRRIAAALSCGTFAVMLALLLAATPAHAQASRTWVSGVGDDANPCSRTAPCKTFAGAISKTAAGGEIDCLDPGGFGAVTITKSITIDGGGTLGSVLVSGTNAINVSGAGIIVRLRNLSLEGIGTGLVGINATNVTALFIENCTIANFNAGPALGINFAPSTNPSVLVVSNTTLDNNGSPGGGGGIQIAPAAGGNVGVTLSEVKLGFNSTGVAFDSTSGPIVADLRDSVVASSLSVRILIV